jgi:signal transduction histidine kinase
MFDRLRSPSLLWKILLSTSIFITALLALAGWFVQDQALRAMSQNLQNEMQSSFRASEALWQDRAEMLRSVSLVLSNMSDVRAAFGTGDKATIRDTAAEIWTKLSQTDAMFLVTDPQGALIASLGGDTNLGNQILAVREASRNFPKQTGGFVLQNGKLYQMVVTPVYVATGRGPGLLNVLVAGYVVDSGVAGGLKSRTGGSDFAFIAGGKTVASTLKQKASLGLASIHEAGTGLQRVTLDGSQYAVLGSALRDMQGAPVGEIFIVRAFEGVTQRISSLERNLIFSWIGVILAGLGGSYLFARRILDPVKQLDRAAARIALQEYQTRVPKAGNDELGRLAETFNAMCSSIQEAREELIRQERISTIGRLSSSIVHDLRNPLAAIYGGAEMLMDGELNPSQVQRLAANIYRSSRAIKDLLQELVDASRQRVQPAELCHLREVIEAAAEVQAATAQAQNVTITIDVCETVEAPVERARMERVFLNLIGNALEAMPDGGLISISGKQKGRDVLISVEDTGTGIPDDIRPKLFQPFVTGGKKNGLGLGLALSRQTVLDHGGELWADPKMTKGARFWVRLPGDERLAVGGSPEASKVHQ